MSFDTLLGTAWSSLDSIVGVANADVEKVLGIEPYVAPGGGAFFDDDFSGDLGSWNFVRCEDGDDWSAYASIVSGYLDMNPPGSSDYICGLADTDFSSDDGHIYCDVYAHIQAGTGYSVGITYGFDTEGGTGDDFDYGIIGMMQVNGTTWTRLVLARYSGAGNISYIAYTDITSGVSHATWYNLRLSWYVSGSDIVVNLAIYTLGDSEVDAVAEQTLTKSTYIHSYEHGVTAAVFGYADNYEAYND